MKTTNFTPVLLLLLLILGYRASAQITLPEVVISGNSYKYLFSVSDSDAAQPVNVLQRKAATFDVKDSDYFEEDYDRYYFSFYLPQGVILATYDKDGLLIRTAEKYKNVKLPNAVSKAVTIKYPNWAISEDIYLVRYFPKGKIDADDAKKTYKLVLKNGSKRINLKVNSDGEFLD